MSSCKLPTCAKRSACTQFCTRAYLFNACSSSRETLLRTKHDEQQKRKVWRSKRGSGLFAQRVPTWKGVWLVSAWRVPWLPGYLHGWPAMAGPRGARKQANWQASKQAKAPTSKVARAAARKHAHTQTRHIGQTHTHTHTHTHTKPRLRRCGRTQYSKKFPSVKARHGDQFCSGPQARTVM